MAADARFYDSAAAPCNCGYLTVQVWLSERNIHLYFFSDGLCRVNTDGSGFKCLIGGDTFEEAYQFQINGGMLYFMKKAAYIPSKQTLYTPLYLTHLHGKIDTPFRQVTHSYKIVNPPPKLHRHSLLTLAYCGEHAPIKGKLPRMFACRKRYIYGRGSLPLIQCTPQHTKFNNASVNFCQLTSEACLSPARCVYFSGDMCLNDRASVAERSAYTDATDMKKILGSKKYVVDSFTVYDDGIIFTCGKMMNFFNIENSVVNEIGSIIKENLL